MSTKTAAPRTCSLTNCKPHHAIAGASPATAAAWCATAVTQGDCGHPARRRIPSEPSLNFPSNRSADSLRSGHPTGLRRNPTGNHNQHHGEQHGQPGPPPIAARPFFHELGDRNEQRGGVFWHVRSQVWWLQQVDGFNRCVQLAVPLATAARRSAPNTISCCEQQIANRSFFRTSSRRLVTPRHPLAPTATGRPEWMQTSENRVGIDTPGVPCTAVPNRCAMPMPSSGASARQRLSGKKATAIVAKPKQARCRDNACLEGKRR